MKSTLKLIASRQITVSCLVVAILLLFFAAMEQDSIGLRGVIDKYFYAAFVYWQVPDNEIYLPYLPGGYMIGFVLFMNLASSLVVTAAFSFSFLQSFLVKGGFTFLIASLFIASLTSKEGIATLSLARETNAFENPKKVELVVYERGVSETADRAHVISQDMLERRIGANIPDLPFTVSVNRFLPNSQLAARRSITPRNALLASNGLGSETYATPLPKSGKENDVNRPAALVTLFNHQTDEVLGTWLLVDGWGPQIFSYQEKEYALHLRHERGFLPFSLTMVEIAHERSDDETRDSKSIKIRFGDQSEEEPEPTIRRHQPVFRQGFSLHAIDSIEPAANQSRLRVVRNPTRTAQYGSLLMTVLGAAIFLGSQIWREVELRYIQK